MRARGAKPTVVFIGDATMGPTMRGGPPAAQNVLLRALAQCAFLVLVWLNEAFSSSVTHDLRDPLLTIDGFVAKLTKKTGGKLDEEERRLLGVIRDTARHMGRLVDDLVHFSRTSRIGMRQNRIDMDALFDGVLTQQRPKSR